MGDQIFIHFQTSVVQLLKFGNGSSSTLMVAWLLIHAGIKVKPC